MKPSKNAPSNRATPDPRNQRQAPRNQPTYGWKQYAPASGFPVTPKQRLPLLRPKKKRIFCGVCRGLSLHLNVPVVWIRLAFVAATFLFGAGIVAYIFLWAFVPAGDPLTAEQDRREAEQRVASAPLSYGNIDNSQRLRYGNNDYSLSDNTRNSANNADSLNAQQQATRPSSSPSTAIGSGRTNGAKTDENNNGPESIAQALKNASKPSIIALIGIALIALAVILEVSPLQSDLTFGIFMALCGIGVAWIRFNAEDGQIRYLLIGVALMAIGYFICADSDTFSHHLPISAAIAGVALLIGVALAIIPLANRFIHELSHEHALKEREEERADMTAHLHDGVLQTLALIQLHSDEPKTVFTLARKQERELRRWLYQERIPSDRSVSSGLKDITAHIEDEFGEAIDVVTVGDTQPSAQTDALLNASEQAMLNAAQHGAEPISVYCEVGAAQAEVFVRDHGNGFDQDAIPPDRLGIRQSIIGRIERRGGSVNIVSRPNWGTEIHMTMPIPKENASADGIPTEDRQPETGKQRNTKYEK
ncbi:PspC domain-containing protein [Bifidobacterium sp. ESL0784]|uniref:ATP-binding protein n=1 Tax=Bifidobacterium sp. ESL0784 TaxID=2983231 RepID=UPI0023F91300|nr:ATP-binding protein [Bifidobacterium sp. ESL0784]MDF7641262.1 PspC domain-containing protein [Bifidobacterium sp. ESL0784]